MRERKKAATESPMLLLGVPHNTSFFTHVLGIHREAFEDALHRFGGQSKANKFSNNGSAVDEESGKRIFSSTAVINDSIQHPDETGVAAPIYPLKSKTEGRENARLVELRVKLHLPELLGGGADAESTARRLGGRRPSFTLNATVALAVGTGDTVILAPFHHRVTMGVPKKEKAKSNKLKASEHPFERALRWSSILEKRTDCSARQLAKLEKTSEPTVSMTLSLMRLTPSIREAMQLLIATGKADHLGLRALAKVAALPAQKQGAAFTALLCRWRIEPENSVSKKL